MTPNTMQLARCKDWIESALEHSGGTHDFWDVVDAIYSGHMQLWPTKKGCLVTEITIFPKKKCLHVFLGGGEIDDLVNQHEKIIKWAKGMGCSSASITGRKGWVRAFKKYGWKESHTTISKEFSN